VPDGELTTAQLAELTGVPAGTLRVWESRYGFPGRAALPGGHRRYSQADASAVTRVLALRAQGLGLSSAIERVRIDSAAPPASVFAALRASRPDLQSQVVSKRALLALTRAIEDEQCARARHGVVIGSFQRERHYRSSEHRWRELARTARLAVALASFRVLREPAHAPIEVPVAYEHELSREWTVIVCAPGASACLAAWELPEPGSVPDAARRFETIWSLEPAAVRAALRSAEGVLRLVAPAVASRLEAVLPGSTPGASSELRFASELAGRAFGYLAAEIEPAP
jgi:DICT domain-containing protein